VHLHGKHHDIITITTGTNLLIQFQRKSVRSTSHNMVVPVWAFVPTHHPPDTEAGYNVREVQHAAVVVLGGCVD
jgi:hypothetical protein